MGSIRASVDSAALNAWRGQLAATGERRGLRTQLLYHRQALLPRFATLYRQLRALPRRLRKALQRRWGVSLAAVALLLTVQPGASEAANFTAGTAAELVTAINTANSTAEADTITLTADITLIAVDNTGLPYTSSPNGVPVITSSIIIAGQGHTIHRDSRAPNFRLLGVSDTGDLTLQDTTLSGGRGAGGGIWNFGSVTLTNSTVSRNSETTRRSRGGGGIVNYGSVTLTNSTVSGNSARSSGGGIFNYGSLTLTDSTVSGNLALRGGGIDNNGSLTLTDSTVSGNLALRGGGISAFGDVILSRSLVSGNTAFRGGGIYKVFGSLTLTDSTVSGNSAYTGGGISFNHYSSVTLTNSTVSGNSAAGNGGGIDSSGGLTLTNSTVSGNSAAGNGGGIENFADKIDSSRATLTLINSTVSGNTARLGGGIDSSAGLTLSRSLVSGNAAPTASEVSVTSRSSFTATFTLLGHKGLTTAEALVGFTPDPSDILATSDGATPTALADILDTTLGDNGGPTRTHNLVTGSPAIDAAGATCDLTTDQRGAPRPVDGNGDGVAACDIGAVEFGAVPPALDCSTATASVDFPRLGNRRRYPVTISGVTAPPGDTVSLTVTSIFQDEPVVNPTGKTCPDGVGVGTDIAKVRNERLLAGDGRVYHIGFTATDSEGASCTGEVKACVPAKEGEVCGDQGALFDSTVCPE